MCIYSIVQDRTTRLCYNDGSILWGISGVCVCVAGAEFEISRGRCLLRLSRKKLNITQYALLVNSHQDL